MKQGTGNNSTGATKVEPRSTAIDPGVISRIGTSVATSIRPDTLSDGRGFTAPGPSSVTTHKSGSQGKH